jgi:hypothetical protein
MDPSAELLPEIIRFRRSEAVITDAKGDRTAHKVYSLRANQSGKRLLLLVGTIVMTVLLLLGTKAFSGALAVLSRFF